MVIRHGEKPDGTGNGSQSGIDQNGISDPESLTVRDWARAGALAALLAPASPLSNEVLARPTAIYASAPVKTRDTDSLRIGTHSRRPPQTISLLANKLEVDPDLRFTLGQEAQMVAAAKADGIVLVCWEHEAIPAIAGEISGKDSPAAQLKWPKERFDVVWVFESEDGINDWTFRQVCQRVLDERGIDERKEGAIDMRVLSKAQYILTLTVTIALWSTTALAQGASPDTSPLSPLANLGERKIAVTRCEESGQYERDLEQVGNLAKEYLRQDKRLPNKPAIVLDIDEMSLSNWPAIKVDDFAHISSGSCNLSKGPCGWNAWMQMAQDKPISATLDLYREARKENLAIFFITGRHEASLDATARNPRSAGYDSWNELIMEPDGAIPPSASCYKAAERKKIGDQGYTIILNMGDQENDSMGGYAQRAFKLANPFYYIS
jgi:predicted secreted acid phosphatase